MKFFKYETRKNDYGRERQEIVGVTAGAMAVVGVPLFLLWFWIFCSRTVSAGEVGIITRFGEVNRVAESGVALKFPWPIEHIEYMETRVQKEEQDSTAATSDLQDVTAKLALNYRLDNATALRVYKELGSDYVARVVTPAVQESFKSASAGYTAQQLVTERPAVKAKAYEAIKQRLDKYGISIVDLNIVNFSFSAEFNKAIEAVQVANQQVAQAKQELEKTKIDAEKAVANAQGQAEAQRLQQQTLTPEMLEKIKLDTMWHAIDKWNGIMPTTNAGDGNVLSIPLR